VQEGRGAGSWVPKAAVMLQLTACVTAALMGAFALKALRFFEGGDSSCRSQFNIYCG